MNLFRSLLRSPPNPAFEPLKTMLRTRFRLCEATALSINEILCADPSCPGTETVILIMEPGKKTRALKVSKSMSDITVQDIDDLALQESIP